MLKAGDEGSLNGDFVSWREVVVKGVDVATNDDYEVDECETGVWESGGYRSE